MGETTTVEVHRDTWRQLNRRKEPGQSMDDVITGLLNGGPEP